MWLGYDLRRIHPDGHLDVPAGHPYIHTGEDITGVMFNRYCKNGNRHTLFMNYGDTVETIQVRVHSRGCKPTVWDTFTGEVMDAQVICEEGASFVVQLELPCTHGIVLVTGM